MKTVRIKESEWLRGQAGLMSDLRRDGKQCCLGFVCETYGVPRRSLNDRPMPRALLETNKKRLPRWLLDARETSDVCRAATINDNESMKDPERKKKLKRIFSRHGLRAVFVK